MKKFLIVSITAILAVSITGCNLVSDTASSVPAASETTSGTTDNISDTSPATPDPEQTSTSETDTAKPAMVIDDDSQIVEKDTTDDATGAPATGDVIKGNEAFYISEITDDIFARIKGKSFKDNCTLPREDLRYLHVLHKDKDGVTHEGEMIVNYHIAEDVLDILKQLYENDYPIEKIRLVDEYGADDETSMEDNNSSSFNFRFISHTTKVSKHGLGLAVDINTLYNPYTKVVDGKRIIEPITGEPYLDRDADFDYKIEKGDLCYDLFISHGFEWGGSWSDRKDYQHFEIPTSKVNQWYP
ncbi:MAG: M15 family metallopeptidase [Lachnospiraceae bacterium]|nr:M15 family metallopeptidase [Lachnospiraceae bacterium]